MSSSAPPATCSSDEDEPWLLYEHSARAPTQLPARILDFDGTSCVGMPVASERLASGEPGLVAGDEVASQRPLDAGNWVCMFPDSAAADQSGRHLLCGAIAADLALIVAIISDLARVDKGESTILIVVAILGVVTDLLSITACCRRDPFLLGIHSAVAAVLFVVSAVNLRSASQLMHALAQAWLSRGSMALRAQLMPAWVDPGASRRSVAATR